MKKCKLFGVLLLLMIGFISTYAQSRSTRERSSAPSNYSRIYYQFGIQDDDDDEPYMQSHTFGFSKHFRFMEYGAALSYRYSDELYRNVYSGWSGYYYSGDGVSSNIVSLKVPVNFMLNINLGSHVTLVPYAGINGRFNLYGHVSGVDDVFDIDYPENLYNDDLDRFQLGWQAGWNLRIYRLYFGVGVSEEFNFCKTNGSRLMHNTFTVGLLF
ncbi:MAG: hypothetical protein J1F13_05520 [Prevotellaceae bacterium]|nr:hypothetical protein [Prevotellaceae bacterium]